MGSEHEPEIPGGTRLIMLEAVDSTNAEAMRRALAGERGPLWIAARRQSAGRGRSGRSWASEPGNLHASLLVTLPSATASRAYQLSLVAGVGVHEAITRSLTLAETASLRLKWPNDLLIGRRKVAGILVESSQGASGLKAVIGIGINVAAHPSETRVPATALAEHGTPPGLEQLLSLLAFEVAGWLRRWQEGAGFAAVRQAWLDRAGPLGERLTVHAGENRLVEGRFAGLDFDGALQLADENGRIERYAHGDVSLTP